MGLLNLTRWRVGQRKWDADAPRGWPLILLYHSIAARRTDPWGLRVSPRHFAQQMEFIRANCMPMRLSELDSASGLNDFPQRAIVVTFDDGYADNLHHALPILKRFGVPATIFITSGYVQQQREFWWHELERVFLRIPRLPPTLSLDLGEHVATWSLNGSKRFSRLQQFRQRHWRAWHAAPTQRHVVLKELRERLRSATIEQREQILKQLRLWSGVDTMSSAFVDRCVTPDQLRELVACDLIEIGSHTVNHASLATLSPAQQRCEILKDKQWLEAHLNRPITSFAYPYGEIMDRNADTLALVKEAGFARACTTDGRSWSPAVSPLEYPRRNVLNWDAMTFAAKLNQWFAASGR